MQMADPVRNRQDDFIARTAKCCDSGRTGEFSAGSDHDLRGGCCDSAGVEFFGAGFPEFADPCRNGVFCVTVLQCFPACIFDKIRGIEIGFAHGEHINLNAFFLQFDPFDQGTEGFRDRHCAQKSACLLQIFHL